MNQKLPVIQLQNVQIKAPFTFPKPLSIELNAGENWIVFGKNGSGKTFFAKTLASSFVLSQGNIKYNFNNNVSQRVSDNILYLTFHDQYSSPLGTLYQLRWNQGLLTEIEQYGETLPTVKDVLKESSDNTQELHQILLKKLNLDHLLEKHIVSLSSGEFRRFQLARVLLKNPQVIIIQNPYIGLDEENRKQVSEFFSIIIRELEINLILITSRIPEENEQFSHIINIEDGYVNKIPITQFFHSKDNLIDYSNIIKQEKSNIDDSFKKLQSRENICQAGKEILSLNDINIRYGERTILNSLSWKVNQGERWALRGKNGAGKSTLLSIICADNPQSYKCDATLFGRRRGTGESIWDIKRNIGFVSPELFRSYRKSCLVESIIASGLYDTIGLFRKIHDEDIHKIEIWLEIFGIQHLRKRNYLELSTGEQRLVLLVRAFVKNPTLLILDEPFHGMDEFNRLKAKYIIEKYCEQKNKTLIMVSHYIDDFPSSITDTLILKSNIN